MGADMLATMGQYITGKVVTFVLVVSGAGAVIWFWRNPEHLATIWVTIKYVLVWLGFVLALPWALFFVTPWVIRKDSNAAAAIMLAGYAIADVLVAAVLMGGVRGHNTLTWMVLVLGFLAAAIYNFKVCEFQVERIEER
jgi:hypothetical protein